MKIKALNSREITSSPNSKNMMNMACNFNHRQKKMHAYHKTHLHTMKVYNTRPVSLTIEALLKFGS